MTIAVFVFICLAILLLCAVVLHPPARSLAWLAFGLTIAAFLMFIAKWPP